MKIQCIVDYIDIDEDGERYANVEFDLYKFTHISLELLPPEVAEGDYLDIEITINVTET